MDMNFKGRVAVVTGAAQGIGEAVARAFALGGAAVAALDKDGGGAERVAAALRAEGYRASAFAVDVGDPDGVEPVVDEIEREMGPIHILANVAGVLRMGSILTLGDEDWETTLAVNAMGVVRMSRAVARRMVPRKAGAIVTVGSNAAGVPRLKMAAYVASKAASTMFTKCLGLELAEHNIRCNVVSPGSTDTAMQRQLWTDGIGEQAVITGDLASYRLGIPLAKLATPMDVAHAVAFLASDLASHITMHDLCIDGGATLGS